MILALLSAAAWGQTRPVLQVPQLERAPTLDDFPRLEPNEFGRRMAHATGFIQQLPNDGAPATERTEAYFGYDQHNIYAVLLCFDYQPEAIRANLTRRENAFDDDWVEVIYDTFHDERHGFIFLVNPLGVQHDGLWTENASNGDGTDFTFDTVWKSQGRLTGNGYVVLIAVPFRSLRFSSDGTQTWGMTLLRSIARKNERVFWPRVSLKINGRMNQSATITGMDHVSPGRNLQFIPYGILRSYRALDDRGPAPRFSGETIGGDIGLDAKAVIKDSLVLDATVNPDFSQVESDEPQTTVNQRFEVFFPEKRPFFLENSNFFDTPTTLVFTRRIIDPDYGVRLSGRVGHYTVGALFADDASPGKRVLRSDPLNGKKAYFSVVRLTRDMFRQSTIGVLYTERDFEGSYNRVGGVDATYRFRKNWNGHAQAVVSSTRKLNGAHQAGPYFTTYLEYRSLKTIFETRYTDTAAGFITHTGFFQRPDIRRFANLYVYTWRPGKTIVSIGPSFHHVQLWDHSGNKLTTQFDGTFDVRLQRSTHFGIFGTYDLETLRPSDFSTLTRNQTYHQDNYGVSAGTQFFRWLSVNGDAGIAKGINFNPASGPPVQAASDFVDLFLTFKPFDKLEIDNSYLYSGLKLPGIHQGIFNSHILRSKVNYQFTRELSLRFIVQHNDLLANPQNSSLQPAKVLDFDGLLTYQLNPFTSFYVGYNSDLSTLDRSLTYTPGGEFLQTRNTFINDGRVFFIKVSYLLRF